MYDKEIAQLCVLEGTLDLTIVMSDKEHLGLETWAHIDHVLCVVTAAVPRYGQ